MTPSSSPERTPGGESVPDLATPVGEFSQKQDVGGCFGLGHVFSHQSDASGLAPRIEFDPNGLNLSTDSILEADREGSNLVDHRLASF